MLDIYIMPVIAWLKWSEAHGSTANMSILGCMSGCIAVSQYHNQPRSKDRLYHESRASVRLEERVTRRKSAQVSSIYCYIESVYARILAL